MRTDSRAQEKHKSLTASDDDDKEKKRERNEALVTSLSLSHSEPSSNTIKHISLEQSRSLCIRKLTQNIERREGETVQEHLTQQHNTQTRTNKEKKEEAQDEED